MTTLSVVIVSYNTRDYLRACLRSVQRETSPSLDYEVIVVDNASSDGSAAMVREEFPWVRLLPLDQNLGFGAGCNRGAAIATGELIALLNPDAELIGDTFGTLLKFAQEHPEAGIYGGRSLNQDGTLDPRSCWALPTLWSTVCFATGISTLLPRWSATHPEAMPGWARDSVREVGVVTGYLLLATREAWTSLGGFDERFFLYGEDVDLGARARRAGFRPTITPDAVVCHIGGAASLAKADKVVRVMTGKVTYVRKHWTGWRRSAGVQLLRAGALVRARGGSALWREVWDRRSSWQEGYALD